MVIADPIVTANPVAVNTPVLGIKLNLVDDVFCGRLPVVVVTHVGYTAVMVVVSSVIAVLVALVAVPDVAAFKLATCVVEATVSGAVPVRTVDVMTPVAETVVNAPEFAVTSPIAGGDAKSTTGGALKRGIAYSLMTDPASRTSCGEDG